MMTLENLKAVLAQRKADYKKRLLQLTREQKKLAKEFHKGNKELVKIYQSAKKNSCSVKRIFNAIFWTIIAVVLSIIECLGWHENGCDAFALIIAIAFYTVISACLAYIVDQTIKEHYNL